MIGAPAVTVRAFAVADAGAVAGLHRRSGLRPDTPEGVRAELARPRYVGLTAELGGLVVGAAVGLVAVEEGHVLTVVVDADHRRRGIGTALVEGLVGELVRRGAPEVTLEVRAANVAAIALYERHGFVAVGRRPGYYPDGEDAVLLTRPRPSLPNEES